MGLETGSHIPELDDVNPPGTDPKSQGDDHLRLVKRCVKGSFPAFEGTTATPKSVALTEDQINDAALKSEVQVVTGAWDFTSDAGLRLGIDNNPKIAYIGTGQPADEGWWDTVVSGSSMLSRTRGAADIGGSNWRDIVRSGTNVTRILFRVLNQTVMDIVSRAEGSLLIMDQLGTFKKAGFRNPGFTDQAGDYTLLLTDEGRIVRKISGVDSTYTVPVLEALETITIYNVSTNLITLVPDGTTVSSIDGGSKLVGSLILAPNSIVQLYYENASNVRVWGNGISQ